MHAFVLFGLIQTLAVVSGAHFNPAVTVVMTVLRQIKPPDAVVYIVAQLGGAVAGTLLTKLLMRTRARPGTTGSRRSRRAWTATSSPAWWSRR